MNETISRIECAVCGSTLDYYTETTEASFAHNLVAKVLPCKKCFKVIMKNSAAKINEAKFKVIMKNRKARNEKGN